MANIKGIHISGHHVVAINSVCLFIYVIICFHKN